MNKINLSIFFSILSNTISAQSVPLPGAHAHNDYNHERPLLDALSYGFTSIEADVLIIKGDLYVGHEKPELNNSAEIKLKKLLDLYLLPLDSIINANDGELYPGYDGLCYLMIDIKSDPSATYMILRNELVPFKPWIYSKENPGGKIAIFISGNRPVQEILEDPSCLMALDGRPEDLGQGFGRYEMPVVSQAFYKYSQWNGNGEIPLNDQEKIKKIAGEVHKENKLLRLWAIPDNPNSWENLIKLGVDIINSDDLKGVRDYYLKN